MNPSKVNERWRVALAGLVASLAIPFLIIDSPVPAEGVVANYVEEIEDEPSLDSPPEVPLTAEVDTEVVPEVVEVVVVDEQVSPDIIRLAGHARTWGRARVHAIADGQVAAKTPVLPPSNTNLALLPVVQRPASIDGEPELDAPAPPAQVNGRVPPPNDGPTADQWDAVRKCESTHNYRAISRTGLYRGAYQFSQQTWDWVAGIYQPHLVGLDPIDAEPAWQDVMAYTLYAMRGWDQWPICGKNLTGSKR